MTLRETEVVGFDDEAVVGMEDGLLPPVDVLECPLGGVLAERHQRSFLVEVRIGTLKPSLVEDVLEGYIPESPCVAGEMEDAAPGIIRLAWDGDLLFWPAWEHLEILGWAAPFGMSASGCHLGSKGFSIYLLVRLKEEADIPEGGLDELMDDVLQALQITWQLGRHIVTLGYWEEFGWEDITAHGLPGQMERVSGLECFY